MTTEHSLLAPSSAARRLMCPASRRLEAEIIEEQSDEADEGTLAHNYANRLLHPLGIGYADIKDPQMRDGVWMYVNYIKNTCCEKGNELGAYLHKIYVEKTVTIYKIHPECFGTPDAWFFDVKRNTLHIFDFKYGFVTVEVFENWQLIAYASGIIGLGIIPPARIKFHIIQPRDFRNPIKTWEISLELFYLYESNLRYSELKSLESDAPASTSEECKYCKARGICMELHETVISGALKREQADTRELTPGELGVELRALKEAQVLLEAMITGLEQQAVHHLRNGVNVPNFKIGYVQSRERWSRNSEEIEALGKLYNMSLLKPAELITPNQAIELGVPKDMVKNFTERPPGAARLEMVTEKDVRKKFAGVK